MKYVINIDVSTNQFYPELVIKSVPISTSPGVSWVECLDRDGKKHTCQKSIKDIYDGFELALEMADKKTSAVMAGQFKAI